MGADLTEEKKNPERVVPGRWFAAVAATEQAMR